MTPVQWVLSCVTGSLALGVAARLLPQVTAPTSLAP
jgi:hypothetical protein